MFKGKSFYDVDYMAFNDC